MKGSIDMIHLTRDKRTGDYYTHDRKFMIERGTVGWNVYIKKSEAYETSLVCFGPLYEYSYSCDTLREVRESLEYEYNK